MDLTIMSEQFKSIFFCLLLLLLSCYSPLFANEQAPMDTLLKQPQLIDFIANYSLQELVQQHSSKIDIVIIIILLIAIVTLFYISYINRQLKQEIKRRIQAEATLFQEYKSTEFCLKKLLEYSPDIICFKDEKGRWLKANQADLKLFQLQNVDYYGKTDAELADYTHPLYRNAFLNCEQTDHETWELGEIVNSIEIIPIPGGSPISLDVVKIPLFDEQKKPSALLVIGRDISDHIEAKEQLASLNNAYQLTNRIRHTLIHAETETVLLEDICQLIVEQKGFCLAWVGRKKMDKQKSIETIAQAGFSSNFLNNLNMSWQDDNATAEALRTGNVTQSYQIWDVQSLGAESKQCNCQSFVNLPIKLKGTIWGVLTFNLEHEDYSHDHLLECLTDDVSFALEALHSRQLHQKMALQIEDSNYFLHTVIDSLTHPFMVINADNYQIEIANKASRSLDSSTNQVCYRISHHRESPCDGVEHPCPLAIMRETLQPTVVEHIHYDPQGHEINVEVHAFPILNAQGKIERFIEYSLDVTKRKRAESELNKLNYEREVILNTLPLGLAWIKDRMVVWSNSSLLKMFLVDQDQLKPLSTESFFPSNDQFQNHGQMCYPSMEDGAPFQIDCQMRRSNGELFWCRLRGQNVKLENPDEGSLWVIEDINDEHQMKQALQDARDSAEAANRSKSAFLANMSHEIRTPMNAIIGLSGLVLNGDLPAKQYDQISKVHQSAKFLISILNDILDFSKIDAEKLELEQVDFTINTVMNNLTSMIGLKADEKGLNLNVQIDPDIPSLLRGDPLRLGQVLTNLGNNAIKFTHKGNVDIKVELYEDHEGWVKLIFDITDTGIGISSAQQKNLFQAFSQADSSTTRHYGGSGLGLTICKKLITLMGGSINVESEQGKGSSFYFSLPFEVGSGEDRQQQNFDDIDDAIASINGAKILLVEDNQLNQELAVELLTLNGIEVSTAWNGKEALDLLKHEHFDGVLMDIQMPVMDGYTASQAIHKQTVFKNLPIIAMTANVMAGDREKAEAAGMCGYISKPLNEKQMFTTMAQWIKVKKVVSEEAINTVDNNNAQFPCLEGINTELGLTNSMNNSELYQRLLGHFYTEINTFVDNFHLAQTNADLPAAIRLAHTLKGTAATIGAMDVSQKALFLEKVCKENRKSDIIEGAFADIEIEIKPVIRSLDHFLGIADPETDYSDNDILSSTKATHIRRAETIQKDEILAVKSLADDLYQENMAGVIFFCSADYDLDILAKAIERSFSCPVMGCTTGGEIGSTYQQGGIVGVSFSADVFCLHTHVISLIDEFNYHDAQKVADILEGQLQFSDTLDKEKMLGFLLIDGLSMREENTVATLYHALRELDIIGGSAGDSLKFQKTSIYANGKFQSNAAVFGLIETKLPFRTLKLQHFKPSENELVITKSDAAKRIVYEINGELAVKAYAEMIGLDVDTFSPEIFSGYPLMLQIAGEWYVRSIKEVNPDGSLSFFCAIDDGLPLTMSQTTNFTKSLRAQIDKLKEEFPDIELTLGCECILRRLEIIDNNDTTEVESLLQEINFTGFNTFGEQFNALHVNQTLTGIVFGKNKEQQA